MVNVSHAILVQMVKQAVYMQINVSANVKLNLRAHGCMNADGVINLHVTRNLMEQEIWETA